MDNLTDKDALIETLLQERDELYQELSKLRQMDGGALEHTRHYQRKRSAQLSVTVIDKRERHFEDKSKN